MNRKLNLVQVNFGQGPKELSAFYLPYSAALLWSFARTIPKVDSEYSLGQILWRRQQPEAIYKQLADADVVGFSSYVWNRNYNYHLAKAIKQYNPRCKIVFGGPDPPITNPDIFAELPFIDYIVKQEGEIAFGNLLVQLDAPTSVSGLLINAAGFVLDTGPGKRIVDPDIVPSPYLSGVFDSIINDNQNVTWNATLETNRGCPYQCTFCDWGSLTYNKIKHFALDRVYAEIEWIGKNRCDWMSITDANFGMFLERDSKIVDHILSVQDRYGYPRRIGLSWAKNQKSNVIDLAKRLTSRGFNNGLTLSVQSLDTQVLKNIKRQNLEVNRLSEIFDLCSKQQIPVNTELILGLPGETKASWRQNVWDLLELGQHNGIEFFQAQLLENAEMNLTQRQAHGIKDITVYDYLSGSQHSDGIPEGIAVVTSTANMPPDDMLESQMFSWFINTWHVNGISQWYARFLRRYANISYEQFYTGLWNRIFLDNAPSYIYSNRGVVERAYTSWMKTGRIDLGSVGGISIHGWNLIHYTVLTMHCGTIYSIFYDFIDSYVEEVYGWLLPGTLFDDLRKFNESYVIRWANNGLLKPSIRIEHNILEYTLGLEELKATSTTYAVEFPEETNVTIETFLENIYYSRRRNYGKGRFVKIN